MAGGMPFFTTPATIASSSSSGGGDGVSRQNSSKKRQADAVDGSLLRGTLEDLVRAKQQQTVPLSDIRDVVMDRVLETLETDLKYTVFLICEDVVDLAQGAQMTQTETRGEEAAVVATGAAPAAVSSDGAVAAAVVAVSTENPEVNASSSGAMPFLDGTDSDWYRFQSQLSEGDSIPRCDATLLRMPVSKRDMEKEKKAAKKSVKMKIKKFKKITGENAKPSAEFYVLSPQELKVHVSSIPFDSNSASEFLMTQPLPDGDARTQEQLLLALDCEMCKTTKGVELARLTLVDANEKVLIDEYVRPSNPIVDYCTQYSGITFDIMEDTTNRLKDAQELFLQHVPAEAILVGHSIENDLQALKILHHRIIDTTALYPHPKGPPFRSALRFLASTYLNKTIQSGSDGHCSVEDAVATLQLVKLKIKHGPTFPSIEQEYKQKKVINELYRVKKTALIVDSLRACRSLSGGVAGAIPCEDNDKITHTVVHQLTTGFPPNFTWARMRGATRQEIARNVAAIQSQLPERSCFVVVLARECSELRELHKLRTTRADPRCSLMWDKSMQAKLDVVARDAQHGLQIQTRQETPVSHVKRGKERVSNTETRSGNGGVAFSALSSLVLARQTVSLRIANCAFGPQKPRDHPLVKCVARLGRQGAARPTFDAANTQAAGGQDLEKSDNQVDDGESISQEDLTKRGAVGRRFAVPTLPAEVVALPSQKREGEKDAAAHEQAKE